jgi:selenium metabolism protein YedF
MKKVNALGDACPIPVVKTKKAIAELNGPGQVEVLVDNEIAVQNLTKMANQKGYEIRSEKLEEQKFAVVLTIGEGAVDEPKTEQEEAACQPDKRNNTVVVCSSSRMGEGNEGLGSVLMKGFIYALTQLDELPATMIFYNGGAALTCEEAPTLEDLKSLEAQGVEILTCGTCLNYYGLTEKLAVGEVTNMYVIAEKLSQASKIIRP